jgi:DNA (cytosine-5)-methyltransferase 1
MRFLSVCSGIEAASVAWEPLGWKAVGFSEIEPFPCAILKHRFPNTPNYGSLTEHHTWPIEPGTVDLLVGGTPCQSYSVAGKRGGLNDPRGQLMLSFLDLAQRLKARWVLWENVPGVLSSGQPRGSDFATFLQGLVERGYGWAYRVLDAQHFGVPQRRRRVFVVACLGAGGWESAAKVLFEPESLCGDTAKGRKKGQGVASDAQGGAGSGGRKWPADTACTLNASFGEKQGLEDQHALGGGSLFVPAPICMSSMAVRRLTPTECERLQGFPDGWSCIPWKGKPADQCPDGPRYKACGNSMAVPVMRWIGSRIALVEQISNPQA